MNRRQVAIWGDAGTATALERKKKDRKLSALQLGTDGSWFEYIIAKIKSIARQCWACMSSAYF